MKQKIILRDNYETFDKSEYPLFDISILPYPVLPNSPDILVLDSFDYFNMLDDISLSLSRYNNLRIVAITEPEEFIILGALFRHIEFIPLKEKRLAIYKIKKNQTIKKSNNYSLTKGEELFLYSFKYGLREKEMAARLNVSVRTIRRKKNQLLEKTGFVSSEQLTLFALSKSYLNTRRNLQL